MKRWLISLFITPARVRKLVTTGVSWLITYAIEKGAWDAVSSFTKWLRKIADFIDTWNNTELPKDKDILISNIVKDAITDQLVDAIVGKVSTMAVTTTKDTVND